MLCPMQSRTNSARCMAYSGHAVKSSPDELRYVDISIVVSKALRESWHARTVVQKPSCIRLQLHS
jgi:hypothetical protein